jgi:hypothetical protein
VSLENGKVDPGTVHVAIRLERSDGQFVNSITAIPDDLVKTMPEPPFWNAETEVEKKLAIGFFEAYRRLVELR